jgi:hypothetical protein
VRSSEERSCHGARSAQQWQTHALCDSELREEARESEREWRGMGRALRCFPTLVAGPRGAWRHGGGVLPCMVATEAKRRTRCGQWGRQLGSSFGLSTGRIS